MPKREMSKEEYAEQQFYYIYNVMSPQDMQTEFKHKTVVDLEEEENRKQMLDELHVKLMELINEKINNCLTNRQKEVIQLYLIKKKQEHMGTILGITQEAVFSRLGIAFKRLRKACEKDVNILKILKQIKKI
jgi:DNA-directed RNA polymerase specialized sigma24 family protein